MSKPRIGIVISTTREGRFGERVARWVTDLAAGRTDITTEIVDLRDYPLPFFESVASPRFVPIDTPEAKKWSSKLAELDGYVFVTAEYNHSISGVLKNALDFVFAEPARKPAAFVAYGAVGEARAVEHLRNIVVELSMVPLNRAVHVNMEPFLGLIRDGKDFADYPYLAPTVETMLEELAWYAETLKAGRDAAELKAA
ncbi:MAG: NAD(P)H-dependent oxidoreductase [Alphaproteobacteria bacterium]|nr:NAD(P)H-dependent oxidoreductase [Alphaproteobacteria bacterium]MBU1561012.1 NAD(P)H-dependent oxidoreductase [Alphaproteobacteria bacterium]MBU2304986.1 NAD(P)H-dependent oxidoreductase [Alphaproteobacteria bacterium]MBU2370238.1 NAD(P)H-dependent oxidoreductase [Alphaproteobacteria bacterium]